MGETMTKEYGQYLAHYGVQGQKWGVRNWQNEDGSYTEAGKHHYGWGYGRNQMGLANSRPGGLLRENSAMPKNVKTNHRQNQMMAERRQAEREAVKRLAEARRQKVHTLLAISAGVSLAGIAAYAGSRGIMRNRYVRDWMRNSSEIGRNNGIVREYARRRANELYDTRRKAFADFIKNRRRWR